MGPQKPGFLENLWVKTKYFRQKPGFFGWVRSPVLKELVWRSRLAANHGFLCRIVGRGF